MSLWGEAKADRPRAADNRRARQRAADLIRDFGFTQPPVDPEIIAETLGFDVIYADFAGEMDQKLSGFYDFDSRNIFVNRHIPTNRKTFTIAHELGHALLHQDYAASAQYRALPRSNEYGGPKPAEEIEADVFAACLLVPKFMLRRYANEPYYKIAQVFAVSPDVIKIQRTFL